MRCCKDSMRTRANVVDAVCHSRKILGLPFFRAAGCSNQYWQYWITVRVTLYSASIMYRSTLSHIDLQISLFCATQKSGSPVSIIPHFHLPAAYIRHPTLWQAIDLPLLTDAGSDCYAWTVKHFFVYARSHSLLVQYVAVARSDCLVSVIVPSDTDWLAPTHQRPPMSTQT
ncbi:hypothetical protein JB92DRAFT_3002185 [Gautieria morchelliformis]|nr:hypothetical protein JB92DRAFT_3002185 [Gautieria morchelliformis]